MRQRQARRFRVESQARGMPFCRCWRSAGLSGSADMANGILIVDKPDGWTSQDVAAKLRACSMKSASGTAGRSTRWQPACCPFSSGAPRAGSNFSSPRKRIHRRNPARHGHEHPGHHGRGSGNEPCFRDARGCACRASKCTGDIEQMPPMYSAIKIGGQSCMNWRAEASRLNGSPGRLRFSSWS